MVLSARHIRERDEGTGRAFCEVLRILPSSFRNLPLFIRVDAGAAGRTGQRNLKSRAHRSCVFLLLLGICVSVSLR